MRKFIINDGDLIIGDVEFHEDLLDSSRKRNETVGGGRWHFDRINKIVYFWGQSGDFGQVTEKQFEDSFKQPSIENATQVFSLKKDFMEVMKDYEEKCNKSE